MNIIVGRILYPNLLADSMFLKAECEVYSDFFPEQLFLVHLEHWFCAIYSLMNV